MGLAESGDDRLERGGSARAGMARLYAVARSGVTRATPHPPEGVALAQPNFVDALAPPCASHGDTARHTALARLPRFEPSRTAAPACPETHQRPSGSVTAWAMKSARIAV